MTNWERVEKLRAAGRDWEAIARDPKIGFRAPQGSDPARSLKVLYSRHRRGPGLPPAPSGGAGRVRGDVRPGRRQWIVFGAILAVMILAIAYVVQVQSTHQKPSGWVGRVAPEFSLAIANGGGSFDLNQQRSLTNVLLFFNEGLSCSPCLGQMQQLDTDAAQFQALHVKIVSITGDSASDMATWAANAYVSHSIVLADPSLAVCNAYETTGAAVSMMPGTAPGHTFVLVDEKGVVRWRADYGPVDMSVPDSTVLNAVKAALGA